MGRRPDHSCAMKPASIGAGLDWRDAGGREQLPRSPCRPAARPGNSWQSRHRTRSSTCRPCCRNRAAPGRRSACRRRAAARPMHCCVRRDRRSAAARTPHPWRRWSSAVPCAPFQLAASSARKISNACRTASGVRSLTTSTAPSAVSRFQSCRSFLRVEPVRLRSDLTADERAADPAPASAAPGRARPAPPPPPHSSGSRVKILQADDVRQRAACHRGEERRDHLVHESRIDDRARQEGIIVRQRFEQTPARTARSSAAARPRRRPAARGLAPSSQASSICTLANFSSLAAVNAAGSMKTFDDARLTRSFHWSAMALAW